MDILKNSFLGGLLIALVLFSARFFGPKVAGILTAIPMVFIVSFLIGFDKTNEPLVQEYLFNVFISACITALFIGLFYFLNERNYDRWIINLVASFVFYFILIGLWINFKK